MVPTSTIDAPFYPAATAFASARATRTEGVVMTANKFNLAEPVIIDRFWKNRGGEAIVTSLSEFKGRVILDVRVHFVAKDGKLTPSKKGLSLAVRRLPMPKAATLEPPNE